MRFLTLSLAASLAGAPLPAQLQPTPTAPAEIVVSATGEARAVPNRALVTIGVESRGTTASEAARENARMQRGILDTLRRMGFEPGQLMTANYNVRPDYQREMPGQAPAVRGYVVSNTVQVTLRDPAQVSAVLDATLGKGANYVHGMHFFLEDPAPARREALANAVANARSEAEALARAAGGTLGAVREVSTIPSGMYAGGMVVRGGVERAMNTPIEPGQASVTATVTMRWVLVTGR